MPSLPLPGGTVHDVPSEQNFRGLARSGGETRDRLVALKQALTALEAELAAKPRTVLGVVSKTGSIVQGEGFSASKTSEGKYKITLTTALATEGVMTVTPNEAATLRYFTVATRGKKEFTLEFRNQSTTLEDTEFSFSVTG